MALRFFYVFKKVFCFSQQKVTQKNKKLTVFPVAIAQKKTSFAEGRQNL